MFRSLILWAGGFTIGFLTVVPDRAAANWWIVKSSDGKCLVVDVKPTSKEVRRVGREIYRTAKEAEKDVKRICPEPVAKNTPQKPKD